MESSPDTIRKIRVTLKSDSGEETSLCLFNLLAHLERTDIWKQLEDNELLWTESKEYISVQKEIHKLQQEITYNQLTRLFPHAEILVVMGTNYYVEITTGAKLLHDHEGKFVIQHAGFNEIIPVEETSALRTQLIDKFGRLLIKRFDSSNRQRQFRAKKTTAKETQVAWYLPTQLHNNIRKQAKKKNLSINQYIVQILNAAIKNNTPST